MRHAMRTNLMPSLIALAFLLVFGAATLAAQQQQGAAPPPSKFKLMSPAFTEGSQIPT